MRGLSGAQESIFRKEENRLFTPTDYQILGVAIQDLEPREFEIIVLRFWWSLTIQEIAKELKISWDEVNADINTAFKKMKARTLSFPQFSRSNEVLRAA